MGATIFKGKKVAKELENALKKEIEKLKVKKIPTLVSFLVGDDAGASVYAKVQKSTAKRLGINYKLVELSNKIKEKDLVEKINSFNQQKDVDGIFLHQPIKAQVNKLRIRNSILPCKDVECEHPENLGKLYSSEGKVKEEKLLPPTPAAVLYTIDRVGLELYGKEVVIIGHSNIVGKPLAILLLNKFATVTVTHIGTFKAGKLDYHIKKADLIISAVGKRNLIKGNWIKNNAAVIDVGITKTEQGVKGDVEYEKALKKASFITPVPGGIGPLTVMFLMKNLIKLCKKSIE